MVTLELDKEKTYLHLPARMRLAADCAIHNLNKSIKFSEPRANLH